MKFASSQIAYLIGNREARGKWDFGTRPTRQGYAGVLADIQDARASNRTPRAGASRLTLNSTASGL